jgi:prepilin-type N-terminal cleavage/methylation domain-containing protein
MIDRGPGVDLPARRLGPQRGMSLIEILIAMLLLGTALIGLAVVFPLSSIAVTDGGFLTVANGLAMEPIERAKRETYATLKATFDTAYGDNSAQSLTSAGFPGFTRTVQVSDYSGGGNGCTTGAAPFDCSLVTVTVSTPGGLSTTLRYMVTAP